LLQAEEWFRWSAFETNRIIAEARYVQVWTMNDDLFDRSTWGRRRRGQLQAFHDPFDDGIGILPRDERLIRRRRLDQRRGRRVEIKEY